MKKIGIICYPTFGGSGIVASELGRGLTNNFEVHFISYEKPVRIDLAELNIFFHKVTIPLYPLFEYPPYELALTATIVEVVKKYNLDLLHVHYAIPHAYAAVNAQKILYEENIKIPIITTLHGTDISLVGKSPFVLSSVRYAINESTIVTCVSNDLKKQTLKYFNIEKPIHVIPNFIEIDKSFSLDFKKNKKKIITHISNFRPVKRVCDVISIFSNIFKKIDSELIMIGDGPELNKAKKLSKKLRIHNNIHFVGKSRNIKNYLKKSDLFLLPSESESFGLVALEAMSFGVPVITTSSGGVTELVMNNKNGFTCNVGDVNEMSNKSIKLLNDKNLYKNFSSNSFSTALKFDKTKIIPEYEKCYKKLLE